MRGHSKQCPRFTALTYAHYDIKTSSKSFCAHYTEEGHASCGRRLEQANFPPTKVAHTICRSICDRLLCGESKAYALDDGDAVVQRKLYGESLLPRATLSPLVQNTSRCVANCSILCRPLYETQPPAMHAVLSPHEQDVRAATEYGVHRAFMESCPDQEV
ncbi:hypothetical protein VTO73DRAFT_3734 [Trametes versicolor]